MSKTVKRVMTVMMIGLVALLGAKAEAHTRWINGKPRTCSICDKDVDEKGQPQEAATLEVPEDWPSHFAVAELIVKTNDVAITCDGITVVRLKGNKNEAILTTERLSGLWTYMKTSDPETLEAVPNFEIDSEQLYKMLGFVVVCRSAPKVQILRMRARYNVYECTASECLSSRVLLSSMKLNDCEVPLNADMGTLYTCKKPIFDHKHPTPTR